MVELDGGGGQKTHEDTYIRKRRRRRRGERGGEGEREGPRHMGIPTQTVGLLYVREAEYASVLIIFEKDVSESMAQGRRSRWVRLPQLLSLSLSLSLVLESGTLGYLTLIQNGSGQLDATRCNSMQPWAT